MYLFYHEYLAIGTRNFQYAKLAVATLHQCSGTNRIKLCNEGFSTTRDLTLMCFTSLFYNFNVSALRNYHGESVISTDAPSAFYLADGLYHVDLRKRHQPMMNNTDFHITRMTKIECHACVFRSGCSSKLTLSHRDLVLNTDMDYYETCQDPFVVRVQLNPLLQKVCHTLPPPEAELNMYSNNESLLTGVCMELAELPEVHTMNFDKPKVVAQRIFHYYVSIPPNTNKALEWYLQTRKTWCFVLLLMTISLISFSIKFTLFRNHWKQFITHLQQFLRSTNGWFLHFSNELAADDTQATTVFLHLSEDKFCALSENAEEVLAREKLSLAPPIKQPRNNLFSTPMLPMRTRPLMLDHPKTTHLHLLFCPSY